MILPTNQDPTLPLNPGKEALDDPSPLVTTQSAPILGGRLSVGTMRRNHLNALVAHGLVERIAVVRVVADQVLRLCFDHVKVEAQLYERTS